MINRLTALLQINFLWMAILWIKICASVIQIKLFFYIEQKCREFERRKSKKKISKVKCINSKQIVSLLLIFYVFEGILCSSQSPSQ